jgi:DNA repair protein RecO (recombination protein O)
MYLNVQALVLRVTDYNDRDVLLTLLTREQGKLTVKARGLRKKNNPMAAPCQLLAYGDFTLFEYRGMYTINEAASIELFTPLRKDLVKLSLATYFAQCAATIAQEDLPNPELLSLVLNCLHGLSALQLPENQVKAAFELRAACIAGYTPDLFGCHVCGSQEPAYFDLSGGALICEKCRTGGNGIRLPINASILDAMRYLTYCDGRKLLGFSMGQENLYQLSTLTEAYLTTQLEQGFSTLDFYKSLLI